MPILLALDVSTRGDRSISRALGKRFVEHWQAHNSGGGPIWQPSWCSNWKSVGMCVRP